MSSTYYICELFTNENIYVGLYYEIEVKKNMYIYNKYKIKSNKC